MHTDFLYLTVFIHNSYLFRRFSFKKVAGILSNNVVLRVIESNKKKKMEMVDTKEYPRNNVAKGADITGKSIFELRLPGQPDSLPPVV